VDGLQPVLIMLATLALLTFFLGLIGCGLVLVRRGPARWLGVALLLQGLLLGALQIALSTVPVGIGEPLIRVPLGALLAQVGLGLLTILLVGGLLYLVARRLARSERGPGRRLAAAGLLLALPLASVASLAGLAYFSLPERERERDPLKREIRLAEGFAWEVFAQGTIDNPTTITFGPDDKLYIADIAGDLWVAADLDQDGKAEDIRKFASGFSLLLGLAWQDGELYVASSGKIEALRDADGDGVADTRRTLVEGLPSMMLKPHSNNGIVFGPDGRLYFGVGSTTNGQVEQNDKAAAVLSIKPDGSDLQVYARGFGNTFDLAFNSAGDLFGGDNSPLGGEGAELPDEFNHIVEGGHYGYPYFYGDPPKTGSTRGPLVTFAPHSVPTGVTFYNGGVYPQEYYDNGFQTLWQRGEIARIEVGQTTAGAYLSRTSTFGSGFLYPIDVVTGPDGNLYVADFGTSAVYRIVYDPERAQGQPAAGN
jgi:putative membrane-bound dehydrogenase-like protein